MNRFHIWTLCCKDIEIRNLCSFKNVFWNIKSSNSYGKQILYFRKHFRRPNLKNINLVAESLKIQVPISPISKHWIQFQVEPTMLEPRLQFETRLKIFKFCLGFKYTPSFPPNLIQLWNYWFFYHIFCINPIPVGLFLICLI